MNRKARSEERQKARDEQVHRWAGEHDVDVERLDEGQKWVVFLALQVLSWIGSMGPLKRLLGCILSHSGMGLSSVLIGELLDCSDRTVRTNRNHSAEDLWKSLSNPERKRQEPMLGPEHAGPVAKYLLEHPGAKVNEILAFIAEELEVEIKFLTLRRFIQRYGLGCLRDGKHERAPLFWERASTAAPFS